MYRICQINAKRVTRRDEMRSDFDVGGREQREKAALLDRKARKTRGKSRREIRRGKCEAPARPASFHGFTTFHVATRGLLTPFDCPSKRLRAPRKRSASRTHGVFFFSFSFFLTSLTDGVVDASRFALGYTKRAPARGLQISRKRFFYRSQMNYLISLKD